MSYKYNELVNLSDEELIQKYDDKASYTSVGINYYMEEIQRRRTEKSNRLMVKLTKWITIMTLIMLISTVVNLIIAII